MAFPQKSSIVIFNSERHLRKTAGMQFCQWIVLAKSLAVFILGTSETDLFVAPPGLSRMGGLVCQWMEGLVGEFRLQQI